MTRKGRHVGRLVAGLLSFIAFLVPVPAHANPDEETPPEPAPFSLLPAETRTRLITLTRPEDLSINDPLYPMLVAVTAMREATQLAIETAETAEQDARDARDAYEQARFDATVAAVRAEHAQRLVNRWAAGMHRNETGAQQYVEIINTALDDPSRMLDIRVWFAQISATRQAGLELAGEMREQSRLAWSRAADFASDSEAAVLVAQEARNEATRILEESETSLEMLLGQTVSYQLVIGADGCPSEVLEGTLRGAAAGLDVAEICALSVAQAPTAEAALAIKYAFRALGALYACEGIGRAEPFRYDCSSLVSRAYAEGAGLLTATTTWIPSTRDLLPWGGHGQVSWSQTIEETEARPGDLVFYDTGHVDSRHVVMLLADGLMLHVAACGDVANVDTFWGYANGTGYDYLGVRRVDVYNARMGALDDSLRQDNQGFGPDAPWLGDGVSAPLDLTTQAALPPFDR